MLIEYSKPNVLNLPLTSDKGIHEGSVMLIPGVNEVAKDTWKRLAALPKIKRLVEGGFVSVEVSNDDTEEAYSLAKLELGKAVSVIKKTVDIRLLEKWAACETRPGVATTIAKQLKEVLEKTTPVKKAANE